MSFLFPLGHFFTSPLFVLPSVFSFLPALNCFSLSLLIRSHSQASPALLLLTSAHPAGNACWSATCKRACSHTSETVVRLSHSTLCALSQNSFCATHAPPYPSPVVFALSLTLYTLVGLISVVESIDRRRPSVTEQLQPNPTCDGQICRANRSSKAKHAYSFTPSACARFGAAELTLHRAIVRRSARARLLRREGAASEDDHACHSGDPSYACVDPKRVQPRASTCIVSAAQI